LLVGKKEENYESARILANPRELIRADSRRFAPIRSFISPIGCRAKARSDSLTGGQRLNLMAF